jgi:hypothetical protein
MKEIIFIVVAFFQFGCNKIFKVTEVDNISVSILNKSINIPKSDTIHCVDTIYFLLENHSKFNFIFSFNETDTWFEQPSSPEDESVEKDGTKVEGINIAFFDINNQKLDVESFEGYPGDRLDNIDLLPINNLKILKSNERIILFSVLKFPNRIGYIGEIRQQVHNLKSAKSIEIIFHPDFLYTKAYINDKKIKMGKKDRIYMGKNTFILPVRFDCE